MNNNKKAMTYIGFLLIILIGAGLLIGGAVMYGNKAELVSTYATVIRVDRRSGESGYEYRTTYEYYVDDERYTFTESWNSSPATVGNTHTIQYDKNNPAKVGNPKNIGIYLLAVGAVLVVAGAGFVIKFTYDSRKKRKRDKV